MIIEVLSKIFDVVVNKVALPIALLCALLLFTPISILQKIEVLPIVNNFRGIIWIIFLFSFLIYIYDKGKLLVNYIKDLVVKRLRKAEYKKQVISNLEGLSPQEEAWIFYCLKNNKRTLIATTAKETAVSLENKGIVHRPSGTYSVLDTPFTIDTVTWDYLRQNKERYCSSEKLNDPNYNSEVMEFIRDLRSVL